MRYRPRRLSQWLARTVAAGHAAAGDVMAWGPVTDDQQSRGGETPAIAPAPGVGRPRDGYRQPGAPPRRWRRSRAATAGAIRRLWSHCMDGRAARLQRTSHIT